MALNESERKTLHQIIEDTADFFLDCLREDHGRLYIVTDGVLYEDEFPALFSWIVASQEAIKVERGA